MYSMEKRNCVDERRLCDVRKDKKCVMAIRIWDINYSSLAGWFYTSCIRIQTISVAHAFSDNKNIIKQFC